MEFSKKKFASIKSIVLSEQPLYAMQFEERVASLIPAMEISTDSFEDYSSAYEHCAKIRNVGLFFLHVAEKSNMPGNAIDELAGPFEAIDSKAGLFVIASNEKTFREAYNRYANSGRLLGISLESELKSDTDFIEKVSEVVQKFETQQVELAVPKVELEFFMKAARKFENLDLLHQMTHLLTYKLDRDWFDNLVIEAGPTLLSLPENQRWILNNSPSLTKISAQFDPFLGKSIEELVVSKDTFTTVRAVLVAFRLYEATKVGKFEEVLNANCQAANSFSPTLKKLLSTEKANFLSLYLKPKERKIV